MYVCKCFDEARKQMIQVHDKDLTGWACEKAAELKLDDFKGSDGWVYDWKKRHGISLREIKREKRNGPQLN